MVTISLRIPEDVIEDLKRVAPQSGFSGHQPLMRATSVKGSERISSGSTAMQQPR